MGKKPARGGRVTPKGTRPATETAKAAAKAQPPIDHHIVNRFDPAQHQRGGAHGGPTRAGHHHGQR